MGLPNFSLLVLYVSHIMKSVENSLPQLLFKLKSGKFLVVGRLRLLFNEVKYALEAVCEPAPICVVLALVKVPVSITDAAVVA